MKTIRVNLLFHELETLDELLRNSEAISQNYRLKFSTRNALSCLYLYFNPSAGYTHKEQYDFYYSKEPLIYSKEHIFGIINYISEIIETSRNAGKGTNIPIVFLLADKAIKLGMDKTAFTERVKMFFSESAYRHSEYREYAMTGTAKKENVQKRIELLWDAIK
ncbi:hypothetical protein [Paenibacillus sp. Mc5Re-14]|uniref:hypothetical protein n=1 Tax=Paenibacillus sp. Mc5Re-14 TaxID=1030529 RepID=UPI000B1B3462|nr:hypothetical protein [Paenibacillus sp. Mc5Re-14]